MAAMTSKDVSEVSKAMKKMMTEAQGQKHAIVEILKLTSQDAAMSKLSKAVEAKHLEFHKAARALFDAIEKAGK